jgi:uncharacterized membrane protein
MGLFAKAVLQVADMSYCQRIDGNVVGNTKMVPPYWKSQANVLVELINSGMAVAHNAGGYPKFVAPVELSKIVRFLHGQCETAVEVPAAVLVAATAPADVDAGEEAAVVAVAAVADPFQRVVEAWLAEVEVFYSKAANVM